ncbi:MAG TPA: hypothetical protein DEB39_11100, partial [Planctomycetaceae bacterium]|nr:hypothetical protein [Planctomycetaceae bacterium]
MPQIRFFPMDRSTEVPVGTTLSEAAGAAGISLRYDCGGSGTCGKCRIEIPGDRVGPDAQQVFRAVRACQTIVEGDLVCRIPADSLPAVRIQSVTDNRLRAGEPFAPVAATGDYGLALDIGTTTLALQLFTPELFTPGSIDPESGIPGVVVRENPQKRLFGDDIIARIQKVCDDPANLLAQQQVLLETLREMIAELAHVHRIDRRRIMRLCVAGNSVMELLLLGLDVVSLGSAPFEPVRRRFEPIPSRALGLDLHPEAVLEAFPLIGGFVGGDLTAGSVACGLTS